MTVRDDGANIDNWTYNELLLVVEKFKEQLHIQTEYSTTIIKKTEKSGWFSSEAVYQIETIHNNPSEGDKKKKWYVGRTLNHFLWLREQMI